MNGRSGSGSCFQRGVIRITIEKQLDRGFDYRKIRIEGMEREDEDTGH